uniref:NADH dehydrogenase subunit 3 n=1 Tax=Cryptomonas gyropyrenoidosa TaxID=233257 RepID=UPI0027AA97B1|nr:NADH dehydrogenase subunit 3 [Cryptomonas gyropyrenoidosa]WFQ82713.1 NADH dehydrogenase subunit 3 [Cryptomonas gyropyrenoidosa]
MLYLYSYFTVLFYLIICSSLSVLFFIISMIISDQKEDTEKLSAYECGFDPFDDARNTFDVRFYLVAILFIIFDLEVSFLFPWCISLGELPLFAFWTMFVFLLILTIGFIYEWKKGALEWE